MKFSLLFAAIACVAAAPVAAPDVQEILLAHTNPSEFANVHSPAGLADRALFLAAHTPNAPNPPNSRGGAGAGAGAGAGGAAGAVGKITGLLGKLGLAKRQAMERSDQMDQAMTAALTMLEDMAQANPNDAQLQQALELTHSYFDQ
ncbi:hypothetical protein HDU91_005457 [Kappamyces sp. JEL0680]|nr:hypothetical protein HDU91_005457 [Kappamyces sp. JEL0680]